MINKALMDAGTGATLDRGMSGGFFFTYWPNGHRVTLPVVTVRNDPGDEYPLRYATRLTDLTVEGWVAKFFEQKAAREAGK
jgi:hypothetical protein